MVVLTPQDYAWETIIFLHTIQGPCNEEQTNNVEHIAFSGENSVWVWN